MRVTGRGGSEGFRFQTTIAATMATQPRMLVLHSSACRQPLVVGAAVGWTHTWSRESFLNLDPHVARIPATLVHILLQAAPQQ